MPDKTLTLLVPQEVFDWLQKLTDEFNDGTPPNRTATIAQLAIYLLDLMRMTDQTETDSFSKVGNA